MAPRQLPNGRWVVVETDGAVLFEAATNAAAWRWIERQQNEARSSSESRHEYGWKQYANGD